MESRYTRASSPRRSYNNPARASTGGFGDPYYDSSHYGRSSSPRASIDRLGAATSYHSPYWNQPSSTLSSRSSNLKYDSYTARPRRNTNDLSRPNVSTSALPQTSLPLRTPYSPHASSYADRPRSPLAPPPSSSSYDKRSDPYVTPVPPRGHKKVYSVDDTSHLTKLVAEVDPSRHRDHADRGYNVSSTNRAYHEPKPASRLSDLNSDGYSYTDPASMYRDTEPAWRRPRAGSIERSSRPASMVAERPPRSSTRELGPPPSTRGFDKINSAPRPHARSSSSDRSQVPKYDAYPDPHIARSSSTRSRAPAIHQEPLPPRRDTYRDEYDRRDVENKRHNTTFEDRDVTSRGFGIAPGPPALAHDHHALDRQPLYPAQEPLRTRPQDPSTSYYQPERAEARMPEARMPETRTSRDRDVPPADYDRRPRERDHKYESSNGFIPTAAGAVAGVAATLGAAGLIKSREKDRNSDRDSSGERERERRKEYDERDRRDRPDERRERKPEGRRNSLAPPQPAPVPIVAAAAAAPPPPPPAQIAAPDYPAYPDPDARKYRDRRHDEDDKEKVPLRKGSSPEGSGDERPRHYVDRDADRRKDPAPQQAAVDPDEEYRRRIQQEAERASRSNRERDSDSDRDRDRRRRKDERDRSRSRGPEERSRASPPRDTPSSRSDDRSSVTHNGGMVQEPETLDKESEAASKSVQIVEPPKEPAQPVKGILRKPTAKFPEDPEPIREGVAPHKDALKGKDIPVGARWTRIDRRLVNPEALEQAKERFEERMDCVIVLRVLTKEEIQKLADRTKKIRESRQLEDDEYDHERREREDRERRSRRSKDDRDDDDRDDDRYHHERERRHRYDDESDYDGRDRSRKEEGR
ncbi:hypothetical protein ACJBU6_04351 [Exserohilum turcicum]